MKPGSNPVKSQPEPARVALQKSALIAAPADELWELISDWAGMLRWWPAAGPQTRPGAVMAGCELIGTPGAVPRTRRMTLGDGTVAEETIVYQNDRTRRISYTKADDGTITGYLASTDVDDLGRQGSAVHLSSVFDVTDPAGQAAAAARFEAVYATMFGGYARYFAGAVPNGGGVTAR